MSDVDIIRQRMAAYSIERGDLETIRAISTLRKRVEEVDLTDLSMEAAVDICDAVLDSIDGALGPGTTKVIFADMRVTVEKLTVAFNELVALAQRANEAAEAELAEYSATVSED